MAKRRLLCLLFISIVVGSLLPSGGLARAEPDSKLGALLRYQLELKREFLGEPSDAVGQLLSMTAGSDWNPWQQRVFVHTSTFPGPQTLRTIQDLGVTLYPETWIPPVGVHPTGFFLAVAPTLNVEGLAALDEVVRLETAEQPAHPLNDVAAERSAVLAVRNLGYTGAGVRVAILDAGLDLTKADLPAPVIARDFSQYPTLDDDVSNPVSGHGTHVAGTLLGRGMFSAGKYSGMAPGAGLIFLKVGDDTAAAADFGALVAAIKAAVDLYDADILNISYGAWDMYHDGTSEVAQAVDYASSRGALVFCAAGNEADDGLHDSIQLMPSTPYEVEIRVRQGGPLLMRAVWFDGKKRTDPFVFTLLDANHRVVSLMSEQRGPESARGTEAALLVGPVSLPPGQYFVRVQGVAVNVTPSQLHLYLPDAVANRISFAHPDPYYTLSTPADAETAVAVAAYVSRTEWTNYQGETYTFDPSPGSVGDVPAYSSRGPTVDGRPKPDIAAPGTAIISVRDSAYPLGSGYDPFIIANPGTDETGDSDYFVMGGTSSACPVAAGAAALLLQAYPALKGKPAIVRAALYAGADPQEDPAQAGTGFLNALRSYNLLAHGTPSPTPTETSTPTNTATPTRTSQTTATPTWTPSPTATPSPIPSVLSTATPTPTLEETPTPTPEPSASATTTPLPTFTATPTLTPTETVEPTPTRPTDVRPQAFLPCIVRTLHYIEATATPTPSPEPTTTPGVPPAYFDDFSNPSSGWAVADQVEYAVGYTRGEYQIVVRANGWKVPSYAPKQMKSDQVRISVKARLDQEGISAYGIIFGGSSLHAFLVSPMGFVALWEYDPAASEWKNLRDWQQCDAVRPSVSENILTVERLGSEANFYVNGSPVQFSPAWRDDESFRSKVMGLIAVSYSNTPIDCRFDDFAVVYP